MGGTPGLTCSECGYQARRERKLFKTRRRWRWAMVSFLLVLLSAAATKMPVIRRGAWPELLPTTALILLSPPSAQPWASGSTSLTALLFLRFEQSKMWDWQVRWWISRSLALAVKQTPWRIITRTRQNWPEGSDVQVLAGLCRDQTGIWIDSLVFRLRVVSPESGETSEIVLSDSTTDPFMWNIGPIDWYDHFQRLKPTSINNGRHRVRLILECGDQIGGSHSSVKNWHVLEDNIVDVNVTIRGSIKDLMVPVTDSRIDDAIRLNLWVAAWDEGMNVVRSFPKLPGLGDDAALGMIFEIVHNGEVVAKTSGWWGNNNARRFSDHLPWEADSFHLASMCAHPEDEWLLRVTGSAELALRAFDDRVDGAPEQTRYWSGQIEIPLKCSTSKGFAIPQREFALWPNRGNVHDITFRSKSCQ